MGPLPRYTADTYCVILCSQNCFVASNSLLSIISGVISCRLRGCASQSESHQATVYGHVFMLVRKCIFYIETAFLTNISRIQKTLCLISHPLGFSCFRSVEGVMFMDQFLCLFAPGFIEHLTCPPVPGSGDLLVTQLDAAVALRAFSLGMLYGVHHLLTFSASGLLAVS